MKLLKQRKQRIEEHRIKEMHIRSREEPHKYAAHKVL